MDNQTIKKYALELYSDVVKMKNGTEFFKVKKPEDLIQYHSTLGMYIRNKYELWGTEWIPDIIDGVDHSQNHPDTISMRIVEEIWKHGRNNGNHKKC